MTARSEEDAIRYSKALSNALEAADWVNADDVEIVTKVDGVKLVVSWSSAPDGGDA